jgi:hypothetical protein
MNARELKDAILNRRGFLKTSSAGLAAAGIALSQANPDKAYTFQQPGRTRADRKGKAGSDRFQHLADSGYL